MIPDAWMKQVLADLNADSRWNERMREKGYFAAQIPVRPFHVRLRRAIYGLITRRREALALRIAPWLEPDDPYDY